MKAQLSPNKTVTVTITFAEIKRLADDFDLAAFQRAGQGGGAIQNVPARPGEGGDQTRGQRAGSGAHLQHPQRPADRPGRGDSAGRAGQYLRQPAMAGALGGRTVGDHRLGQAAGQRCRQAFLGKGEPGELLRQGRLLQQHLAPDLDRWRQVGRGHRAQPARAGFRQAAIGQFREQRPGVRAGRFLAGQRLVRGGGTDPFQQQRDIAEIERRILFGGSGQRWAERRVRRAVAARQTFAVPTTFTS
jgi:hypothetical protein